MHFTQIKETCLYTSDLKRAEEFYSHILGLEKIVSVENRHVFFRVGTSVLLIFNPDVTKVEKDLPPHFGSGQIHIALEVNVEDYMNIREKILSKGVIIELEKNWPGGYKSFYFRDPDKHLLEIVQKGMWGN
jgi:catechol 2,3-dioxygenase-like lactoylglutathione lyase family enzyme